MVKLCPLTDLAKGWGMVAIPPPPPSIFEILTIACMTFCLLLTDRPTPGLPEYKLKVVNICKCTGQGVFKLWCYEVFDRFQRHAEIIRKSDEKVL